LLDDWPELWLLGQTLSIAAAVAITPELRTAPSNGWRLLDPRRQSNPFLDRPSDRIRS